MIGYEYDTLGRLTKLTHCAPDATPQGLSNNAKLAEFDDTHNTAGQRTSTTETFWFDGDDPDTLPEPHTRHIDSTYDAAGRLVDVCSPLSKHSALWITPRLIGVEVGRLAPCLHWGGHCLAAVRQKTVEYGNLLPYPLRTVLVSQSPMDAVYIFRHSAAGDMELRYSLRSLARHAPWLGKVWIFGDRPAWITSDTGLVEHLAHDSIAWLPGYKTPLRNTFLMMLCAAIHPRLPAEFLWMCDDYILLRDFSPAAAARVRYIENLDDQTSNRGHGVYRDALWRTYDLLVSLGLPRLNYETHVPMPLSKGRILAAANRFHSLLSEDRFAGPLAQLAIFNHACACEQFEPLLLASENSYAGFHYRPSLYADILRETANKTFLNFDDIAFGPDMRRFLAERFPDPSPYESADAPPITEPPTFESPATNAGSAQSPSSAALLIAFPEQLTPDAQRAVANLKASGWRVVSLGEPKDSASRVRNRLLPAGLRTHCDELVWIDGRYPLVESDLHPDQLARSLALIDDESLPIGDNRLFPFRLSRRLIIPRIQQHRLPTHQLGQSDEWIPFFPEP